MRVERDSGMCVARDLYELWGRSPYTRMLDMPKASKSLKTRFESSTVVLTNVATF